MSTDTVDDLHAAEEMAGRLCAALEALYLTPTDDPLTYEAALDDARAAIRGGETYCRPSCSTGDDGECLEGDTCGCPCGHADLDDEPPERELPSEEP